MRVHRIDRDIEALVALGKTGFLKIMTVVQGRALIMFPRKFSQPNADIDLVKRRIGMMA